MLMLESKSHVVNGEKTLHEMGCKSKGKYYTQMTDSDSYSQNPGWRTALEYTCNNFIPLFPLEIVSHSAWEC